MKNEIDVQRLPHLILIDEEKSIKFKKILFNISIISTIGLAVFFFKHRVYCHDLAFSAFAFCEYIIAVCNLAFHSTTMLDFPSEYLMIARRTTKLKLKHPTGWKLDQTEESKYIHIYIVFDSAQISSSTRTTKNITHTLSSIVYKWSHDHRFECLLLVL